jgi:predicted negative regulator of RcsB-dependent stress response
MASHLDLEEQEQLEQLKAFWKQWGNLITWVVTACLAVFAAWQGWNTWQRNQAVKAESLYVAMQKAVQEGDLAKVDAVQKDLQGLSSTSFAAQGVLLAARVQFEKGKADVSKASLNWVIQEAKQAEVRDVARLRLAGVLLDEKKFDEAAHLIDAVTTPDFTALAADRRGDLLMLQNKPAEAKAQYQKAYAAMDKSVEYRRLIEAKLAQLGVAVAEDGAAGKEAAQ